MINYTFVLELVIPLRCTDRSTSLPVSRAVSRKSESKVKSHVFYSVLGNLRILRDILGPDINCCSCGMVQVQSMSSAEFQIRQRRRRLRNTTFSKTTNTRKRRERQCPLRESVWPCCAVCQIPPSPHVHQVNASSQRWLQRVLPRRAVLCGWAPERTLESRAECLRFSLARAFFGV